MIAGYPYFLDLARRLHWDEAGLDLASDRPVLAALGADARGRLRRLVAGFVVGERSVAAHLGPFAAAADAEAAACFAAQSRDEARHARFFARAAREAVDVPEPEAVVGADFADLFRQRLPDVARELSVGAQGLGEAVTLYHMVLEGTVFTAGLLALIRLLETKVAGEEPTGLLTGARLVLRDERWHLGLGVRALADVGVAADALAATRDEGERALRAWGDAIDPETAAGVVAAHCRRLGALPGMASRPAPVPA